MSQRLSRRQVRELIVVSPARMPDRILVDRIAIARGFGFLTRLYAVTVALYLAFIGVMAALFLDRELAISMVIFAGFVAVALGLAGAWGRTP